ncbi:ABC transporter ATP-binding protein [Streptomonospora algeriensis]|uniref:ABC transporter ATP-binding protein n=1 Tax=Streptomonospora algeriensis TaxID=995084 RepID=A0ABW3BF42_9ACTN
MSTAEQPTAGPGAGEYAISVRDLRQNYGDFEAVRGISFEVEQGELFALLGTNGAGKTTTVETLEGFRRPSAGSVRVLGTDPYGQPAALRESVDAVLQHSGLFPELTVAETVDLSRDLAAAPMSRDEVLELTGLADKAGVQVRRISGGQKRRLDLGLAVLSRPEVLFLDEPTTGMDPEARRATWETIADLVRQGTAILLTTHYLEEAERLADRLAIMHRGETRAEGTVRDVVVQWGDRIAFRMPAGVRVEDLPELPGATAAAEVRGGEAWTCYTVRGDDADGLAHRAMEPLLEWARRTGTALERLELRSASLEDVFLSVAEGAAGVVSGGRNTD